MPGVHWPIHPTSVERGGRVAARAVAIGKVRVQFAMGRHGCLPAHTSMASCFENLHLGGFVLFARAAAGALLSGARVFLLFRL
jgi:hypothetical protein